jgi:integrase
MSPPTDRFDRWYRNVARGSQLYADVSRRRLTAFVTQMKTDPDAVAGLSKDALRRLVEDYLDEERELGHSGEYVRTTLKALRSWLVYNEKELPKGLKVPNERSHPRVEREEPVTTDQLRKAVLAATPGQRVVIALMAFSGVRPQVLGSYDGSDGLRVGDLPELELRGTTIEFKQVPTLVRVRASSSKAGHAYLTFLGTEGCEYLKLHLEERLLAGETIDKETDIVSPSKSGKRFMTTINVGDRARQALRAAGIAARPYALRSYFFSRCLEAANAGRISDRYVEFWSGHTGDVTSRHYTTGRPNLPASMIEDMRAAYRRCEPFLSTAPAKEAATDPAAISKMLLMSFGYDEEELADVDLSDLSVIQALVARKMGIRAQGQLQQMVVDGRELPSYLAKGWTVVTALNARQVVLNPPDAPRLPMATRTAQVGRAAGQSFAQ